jgi:hypothetical protein
MKFNNASKIAFDGIMLALLVAVYCAQPTGIPFHEYAGLAIYIFFIIHLAYNYRWIVTVGKRLFGNTIPMRTKIMYTVDLMLLGVFILVGLSGILISSVIFKLRIMPVWRPMHSITSAISLVLLGVHIGLHGNMIVNTVTSRTRMPRAAVKITAGIVAAVILCGGIYGVVISKSGETQNAPFPGRRQVTVLGLFERSISLLSGPPEYVRNRQAGAGGGENSARGHGGQRPEFSAVSLLLALASYVSFILLCSLLVYAVDKLLAAKKRQAG